MNRWTALETQKPCDPKLPVATISFREGRRHESDALSHAVAAKRRLSLPLKKIPKFCSLTFRAQHSWTRASAKGSFGRSTTVAMRPVADGGDRLLSGSLASLA